MNERSKVVRRFQVCLTKAVIFKIQRPRGGPTWVVLISRQWQGLLSHGLLDFGRERCSRPSNYAMALLQRAKC